MNRRKEYPYWAYPSFRAWQRDARKRVRAALKALDVARNGCVFYPRSVDDKLTLPLIYNDLRALHELMRPVNWR